MIKKAKDSSPEQAHQKPSPMDQIHQEPSPAVLAYRKHHPHEISKRLFLNIPSISRTLSSVRKQKILPQIHQTYQTLSWKKQKTLPQYFKHLKNTILSKEAEDSSSNGPNLSTIIPIEEAKDYSSIVQAIKLHTHRGGRRFFIDGPKHIKAILSEEAEDSFPKYPQWGSIRFFDRP